MLRRLRRKHEYDNVEEHSYENPRPQISQHEVNAIADEVINQQPHVAEQQYDHTKEQPMMQSNRLLNAVHVDVIPPSVIDSRSSSRSRARQRLDVLSRHHIDDQDKHSKSSRDTPSTHKYSNKSRDTTSTGSSTLSNSTTVEKRDLRKASLLANAFTMGLVCNTECMTPFARHALPTISMDSESAADSSSMNHRCRESSRGMLVAATVEHSSLEQPRSAELNKNNMIHAYAYNPAPPKRRTRQTEVCEVNNGTSKSRSPVTAAVGISKVGDVEMQLVEKHGYDDTKKDAKAEAAIKNQVGSPKRVSQIKSVLTRQISPSPRHDAVQQTAADANRKSKPSIFKAISPMLSYPQQDPSGAKQVTVSLRGSAIESNDSDKKKETPILKSTAVVPKTKDNNVFRKALGQRQQRSPSPPRRTTSPPLDAPADNLANANMASQPISKIRKVFQQTPSPTRIAQSSEIFI